MRKICFVILTAVFFIDQILVPAPLTDYTGRMNELSSDSAFISSLSDSLRSDIVKQEIISLLNRLSESRKLFRPFDIDIYRTEKKRFVFDRQEKMTVSEVLDHIEEMTRKARILRINRLDLDNGKNLKLSDNSFKDLIKEPGYRSKEKIMAIIEETAMRPDKKSSLEWIWGKSRDDDAYYSTRLTYFDDRFSLYPEYRSYIGTDPFRDKKSWYFTLEDYPEIKSRESLAATPMPESPVLHEENMTEAVKEPLISESNAEPDLPEEEGTQTLTFDCGCQEKYPDFSFVVVFYHEQGFSPHARTLNFSELFSSVVKDAGIRFIRLTGTDFSFEGSEVKKTETESVIEITGDIQLCSDRLKKHLAEGITDPDRKRTAELIHARDKNGMSYYASVITVYDGQATFFKGYKIYASSEVRKAGNSWFNRIVTVR